MALKATNFSSYSLCHENVYYINLAELYVPLSSLSPTVIMLYLICQILCPCTRRYFFFLQTSLYWFCIFVEKHLASRISSSCFPFKF